MKYLAVVAVCVSVFFVSQIIPQSGDERFYLINSTWSMAIIYITLMIQRTKTVYDVCVIESIITIVNLITCIDYLNGKGFPYAFYPTIINSLNAIEAAVLIIGAPWIGAYNRFTTIISNIPFIGKRYSKLVSSLSGFKPQVKKGARVDKRAKK